MNLNPTQFQIIRTRIRAAKALRDRWQSAEGIPDAEPFGSRPAFWLAILKSEYWTRRRLAQNGGTVIRSSNQILPKMRSKQDILTQGETAFVAEPLEERFAPLADQVQAALEDHWRGLGFESEVDAARWDSDLFSIGVVEMGWLFKREGETGLAGERGEPLIPEDAQPLESSIMDDDALMQALLGAGQEFSTPADARAFVAAQEKAAWGSPKKDDPFVERFSPLDLLIDPQCRKKDFSDARYVIREKMEYVSRLKADKRYKNTEDLKGTMTTEGGADDTRLSGKLADIPDEARDDARMVKLYDGYYKYDFDGDGDEEVVHVISCDEVDKPLLVQENPYEWPDDNPFPFVICEGPTDNFDEFYQNPPIHHAAGLQLNYDEARHQLNQRRRKSNRQFLVPEGTFKTNPQARQDVESGEDGAIIEVNPGLIKEIREWPLAPVQPEVYSEMTQDTQEIARQLGVNEFSENVVPNRKMLATEVVALQNEGSARESGDAERFRKFKETVALRVIALLQQFAVTPRQYTSMDTFGAMQFNTISMGQLRGVNPLSGELEPVGIQWKIKVDAENEHPRSKALIRQEYGTLLQALTPFIQAGLINPVPLLIKVLKAFDIKDIQSVLTPGGVLMAAASQGLAAGIQPGAGIGGAPSQPGEPGAGPASQGGLRKPPVQAGGGSAGLPAIMLSQIAANQQKGSK